MADIAILVGIAAYALLLGKIERIPDPDEGSHYSQLLTGTKIM
ncbi:MAG: hypothetical protein WB676_10890 [Bryobacteraceae bacterium]